MSLNIYRRYILLGITSLRGGRSPTWQSYIVIYEEIPTVALLPRNDVTCSSKKKAATNDSL